MFGAVAVGVFVLFFILIVTVKNETALKWITRAFLATVLGALTLAGTGAILTGVVEGLGGRMDLQQVLVQVGGGLVLAAAGAVPFYVYFFVGKAWAFQFEARRAKYPDAPWMWLARWSRRRLNYSARGPIGFMWFVLLVLACGLAFVTYMNRAMVGARLEESPLEVIGFFVLFGGILFLGFMAAVRMLRGYMKWGDSAFEMTGPCGTVGGELAGTISTGMREIPERGFELSLECVRRDLSAPRRGRSGRDEARLFGAHKQVPAQQVVPGSRGAEIPVTFAIPADAMESDGWSPLERIEWTLRASASLGARAYYSEFLVPVFKPRAPQSSGAGAQAAAAGSAQP